MAGTSGRSSEELKPDLSGQSAPKKFKPSEELDVTNVAKPAQTAEQQSATLVDQLVGSSEGTVEANPQHLGEEDTGTEIPSTSYAKESRLATPRRLVMDDGRSNDQNPLDLAGINPLSDTTVPNLGLRDNTGYEDLSIIGNGAYGTVYKAKDRSNGQVVALKKVRIPLSDDGLPVSTLREIAALKSLDPYEHPNIVRLLDVCQGDYLHFPSDDQRSVRPSCGLTLWLVFEHVERDLASFIDSYRKHNPRLIIPPSQVKQMMKELLNGVDFLHSHRILHRDLKPQNLLVTREGRIKIADFGLAKTYDFEMRLTSLVVTQWYRAPEVLLGCSYATPIDIWSAGCIFAELCKLEPLFPGTSEGDQLDRIFQVVGTPSQEAWPENVSLSWTAFPHRQAKHFGAIIPDLNEHGLCLIKSMLMFDPHSRPTAAQALTHVYFAD